nr:hypothetical protein [Gemmatimonadota bacterium]
ELAAVTLFVWVSTGLLAYGLTSLGWSRLPLFLSVPFFVAVHQAQWSPIFTAAACLPALGWILAAKPNIGLAILAADQSGRTLKIALLGGGALALIGFLFVPTWLGDWLASLPLDTRYSPPLLSPLGWLSILALLRWRRPEARLILVLACVPQTAAWYDVLPLFLVAVTFRETLFLSLVTSAPVAYELLFGRSDGFLRLYPVGVEWMAFACLPALIILLRRPNEGELPAWLSDLRRVLPMRSFSKAAQSRRDGGGAL